jgi:hypothetical protein
MESSICEKKAGETQTPVEFSLGKSKKKKNYSNYYALRGVNKR